MSASSELVLLVNGLTDVPLDDLDGHTPLQKAHTPTLDSLAREGDCRLALPPPFGGFETAFLALLGLPTAAAARGPLEAYALGRPLDIDEVAYCARFTYATDTTILDLDDELVTDQEAAALCRVLTTNTCQFLPLSGPNILLITREPSLVAAAKPHGPQAPIDLIGANWKAMIPDTAIADSWQSTLAAQEINTLKAELDEPQANSIILSDGGHGVALQPDASYQGTLLYTTDFVSRGIARRLGIPLWAPPTQGEPHVQLQTLAESIPIILQSTPRLIVELDYIWESTYSGSLLEKIKRIEWFDKHFLPPLKALGNLTLLPLRGGDIRRGAPTADPVPVVIYPGSTPLPAFDEACFSAIRNPIPMEELLARA